MDNNSGGTFDPNDGTWLTKAEAAILLRTKPRQLERRAEQGYIQKVTLEKKPWDRAARVVYSRGDIEAILRGKPNHHAMLVRPTPAQDAPADGSAAGAAIATIAAPVVKKKPAAESLTLADLAGVFAAIASRHQAEKPWLTLKEAAEYSGLPVDWLRARAQAGEIVAINVGAGKLKHWRFNREALSKPR